MSKITEQAYLDLTDRIRAAGGPNAEADGFCVVVYMDDLEAGDYAQYLERKAGQETAEDPRCTQCQRKTDAEGRHLENGAVACPREPGQEDSP